jgi:hypothetical protein
MKKNLKLLAGIFFLCAPLGGTLWGADFGLILDGSAAYGDSESDLVFADKEGIFEVSGALIPWFSVLAGDTGSVYISASARADKKGDTLTLVPELLRTEFSWGFGSGEFTLGRMQYADPLGIIASGLFDGINVSIDTGGGSVSVGGWYTGYLYKERANITMTQAEAESYNTALDYEYFTDTYFAPRRVVAALGWEHQNLAELMRVQLALVGQFDLAEKDKLNSQYAAVKLSVPVDALVINLGGCLEAMEDEKSDDDYNLALAGELGIAWMFPSSRISLSGRYSSGTAENGSLRAFLPLTTIDQGNILKAKLSGISVISLDYLNRVHRTFSAGVAASCFVRNDLGTYNAYPVTFNADDGYVLGTELFARLLWSPVSDVQMNLGGGGFLPVMGNTNRNAPILWHVELNLILALY